jgi:hypothetical protein
MVTICGTIVIPHGPDPKSFHGDDESFRMLHAVLRLVGGLELFVIFPYNYWK